MRALYERGAVHTDIHEKNLMFRGMTPVLVDFGLAWRSAGTMGREVLDVATDVVGTPAYMAPEQIRGDLIDARADLYATGCLLYELLTSRPPFVGVSTSHIMDQHLNEPPLAPSALVEDVPPDVDRLILALLEKRPNVVPKADLFGQIWPDVFVVEGNLNVLVGEIRRALGDDPQEPRFIRTVHGMGYAFCGRASDAEQAPQAGNGRERFWLTWKSQTFALADGPEAFRIAADANTGKVMFRFD